MVESRVVFITGAGSGIGFDTACRFITTGATVIACDRDTLGLQKMEQFSQREGKIVEILPLDLLDVPSFNLAEDAVRKYGHLDVLVNCAGICSGTPLDQITIEEWDRTYAVNIKGPFFLTIKLLPFLKAGNQPTIINISSMAGFTGGIKSNPAYSSSKAAVTCMTKNLAKFCAPFGIRVNEVSPGTARTAMVENWLDENEIQKFIPQIPMGRLAEADDISRVIVFLASKDAGFITGQTIHVNGGMYIP